jgi:hypothetical protein
MTSASGRSKGTPQEPSAPKRPADTEQARRTWAVAQETDDDVAASTERILREREREPPAEQDPGTPRATHNRLSGARLRARCGSRCRQPRRPA